MSWFFGKKKHQRESPTDTPEEAAPSPSSFNDYIIVEKQGNPLSPTTGMSGRLYPYLGNRPSDPPPVPPSVPQQQSNSSETHSYLHGVPFKLNKSLNNDFEIDRIRVDEIMTFIVRIKNEDYEYDFGLERSIINEMESGTE